MFYFKDWINIRKGGYEQVVHKKKSTEGKLFWYIVAVTIPTGVVSLVLDKFSETICEKFGIEMILIAAAFPGTSRSGITMTVARALKVDRESAAKYSFLLSTPIILAAVIVSIADFELSLAFFAGLISSFLVGIVVIKFLLDYLKKGSFKIFAIYRVILGLLVIAITFMR